MNSLRKRRLIVFAAACLPFLLPGSFRSLQAGPTLYERLLDANLNWAQAPAARKEALQYPVDLKEPELLKTHLRLVEESLRASDVTRLSPELRRARAKNLDSLHEYWSGQRSPRNHMLPYRNPVFIDEQNSICAVGYLMVRDGQEKLASLLAATNDTVFIRDVDNIDFLKWAAGSGLTIDELAWIQPMYGPASEQTWTPVGKGIQGQVYSIVAGKSGVYGAGRFDRADNAKIVRNVGYFDGKSWQPLGAGTNGPVYALAVQDGIVYAGGEFGKAGSVFTSNVAMFDTRHRRWKKMGEGLPGPVTNLVLYGGNLYASGSFLAPGSDRFAYVKRWNAKEMTWDLIGEFNGEVRALTVYRNRLVLGGDFTRIDAVPMSHIAAYDGKQFTALASGVQNSFTAMTVFKDHLVVGSLTFTSETGEASTECKASLQTWDGSSWKSHVMALDFASVPYPNCFVDGRITALAPVKNALAVAYRSSASFKYPGSGNPVTFLTWTKLANGESTLSETGLMLTGLSEVNSIVVDRNQILLGGSFETDSTSFVESASRRIGPGRNVLPYYALESGLNRVRFGSVKGETMHLPADVFK